MTTAINHVQQDSSLSFSGIVCGTAILGCAGAAAAAIFTTITPLGGAIFGASYFLSSRIIHWICDAANCCPDNIIAKIATYALSTFGGIAVAAALTTAYGIPMTFVSGVILAIATIGTAITTILTLGGCLCSSAIATGVALGNNDGGFTVRA